MDINENAAVLSISHVEDHEGSDGECGHCGRQGLRWVIVLSNGMRIGSSCMRKVLGWAVPTTKINWVLGKTLVATKTMDRPGTAPIIYTLWTTPKGHTSEGRNGHLNAVGGMRKEWEQRGWL